jgi:peptide chain release factor 1
MQSIIEYLQNIVREHQETGQRLSEESVYADQELYRNLSRRFAFLEKVIKPASRYLKLVQQKKELGEMLDLDGDEELTALAREELPAVEVEIEELADGLEELLFVQQSEPDRSVIIEIRPAAGGQESALFATELYRMYERYADIKGWKVDAMDIQETELGGLKEAVFGVRGEGAYAHLKFESGVHRVQRVPATEASGRIHTSTVTVAVMKEPEDIEVDIDPADLKIDTYRASGAGGQHVNKTDSAVRITHQPTGIVVACQDERSQIRNKDKALRILKAKILDYEQQQQQAGEAEERRRQIGSGERSEKIRTYNYPQRRVTDHRGPFTVYRLEEVLEGNLDLVVKELMRAERKLNLPWQSE